MIKYIVVYGSLEIGHTFYGPFETMSEAILWATVKWGTSLHVQVLPLISVAYDNVITGDGA